MGLAPRARHATNNRTLYHRRNFQPTCSPADAGLGPILYVQCEDDVHSMFWDPRSATMSFLKEKGINETSVFGCDWHRDKKASHNRSPKKQAELSAQRTGLGVDSRKKDVEMVIDGVLHVEHRGDYRPAIHHQDLRREMIEKAPRSLVIKLKVPKHLLAMMAASDHGGDDAGGTAVY
ncbi:MAG: hypothetical protein Q9170_004387 [Blastenia crenularia]